MPDWLGGSAAGEGWTDSGLFYRTCGKGPPILALHGLGETTYLWRHVAPRLEGSSTVHLVDLKGHGRSSKPHDDRYSLSDQADLIYEYIVTQDLRDVTLMGHSMGGGIAVLLAIRFAKERDGRLRSLVLVDSITYPQELPLFIKLLRIPLLARVALAVTPPSSLVRMACRVAFHDPHKIASSMVEEYSRPLRSAEGRYALVKTVEQLIPTDIDTILDRLKLVTLPALLIWGENDRIVPAAVGRRLKRELPQATLRLIPGCGHIPQEEHPERFAEELLGFLSDLALSTRGVGEC